jgi:hypothetical protein
MAKSLAQREEDDLADDFRHLDEDERHILRKLARRWRKEHDAEELTQALRTARTGRLRSVSTP